MIMTTMQFMYFEEERLTENVYVLIEKVNKKSIHLKITETDGNQIINVFNRKLSIKETYNQKYISFNYEGTRYIINQELSTHERIEFLNNQISKNNQKLKDFYNV
jgi:CRISPR type III-B/RAMP module RAMP protein Cmr1